MKRSDTIPPVPSDWHAAIIGNRNRVMSGPVRGRQPQSSQRISIDRAARWGPLTVLARRRCWRARTSCAPRSAWDSLARPETSPFCGCPAQFCSPYWLRSPVRTWPLYLACSVPANLAASMIYGDSALIAGGFTVINMIEVLCGVPVPSARGR